jgi:hypothetical protein
MPTCAQEPCTLTLAVPAWIAFTVESSGDEGDGGLPSASAPSAARQAPGPGSELSTVTVPLGATLRPAAYNSASATLSVTAADQVRVSTYPRRWGSPRGLMLCRARRLPSMHSLRLRPSPASAPRPQTPTPALQHGCARWRALPPSQHAPGTACSAPCTARPAAARRRSRPPPRGSTARRASWSCAPRGHCRSPRARSPPRRRPPAARAARPAGGACSRRPRWAPCPSAAGGSTASTASRWSSVAPTGALPCRSMCRGCAGARPAGARSMPPPPAAAQLAARAACR